MRGDVLFCVLFLAMLSAFAVAYDWSTNPGNGDPNNPYQISEPNQFNAAGTNSKLLDKYFILTDDIDLSAFTGTQYNRIGVSNAPFTGVFDGRGHTISNLTYISASTDYVGLFGAADHAQIMNVNLENVYIEAHYNAGALAGYVQNSTISNCCSYGTVSGFRLIGGLFGVAHGNISGCTTSGTVTGGGYVGGLAGALGDQVQNCHSEAAVNGSFLPNGNFFMGGLVGQITGGFISDCSASGTVTTASPDSTSIGGFVGGFMGGYIRRCFAAGDVVCSGVPSSVIGGFAGGSGMGNYPPAFYDCYARGNVLGDQVVGGFIGSVGTSTLDPAKVINCYSTGQVQGNSNVGGLIGDCYLVRTVLQDSFWDTTTSLTMDGLGSENPDPNGITGLDTILMQQQASFTGWDFVDESANGNDEIWRMCVDGVDYPRFSWEFAKAGDFACPNGVGSDDLEALSQCWLKRVNIPGELDDDNDAVVNLGELTHLGNFWLSPCFYVLDPCSEVNLNGDISIDMDDLFGLAKIWLSVIHPECVHCDANGDDQINLQDFAVLSQNWQ